MSKIPSETLNNAVKAIKEGAEAKKRNFVETIELQVGLKDYDTQRDKRFAGTIRLPHVPRERLRVCVIGDEAHLEEARAEGLATLDLDGMKKMDKDTKAVKRLAHRYDAFIASPTLIGVVPKLLGPGLTKLGKFPVLCTHNEKLSTKVMELKSNIKFQLKKVLCMGVAVGNVDMTEEQIRQNLTIAINFLVSLLKKNWQNIRTLTIKSTMGRPQRIYG